MANQVVQDSLRNFAMQINTPSEFVPFEGVVITSLVDSFRIANREVLYISFVSRLRAQDPAGNWHTFAALPEVTENNRVDLGGSGTS